MRVIDLVKNLKPLSISKVIENYQNTEIEGFSINSKECKKNFVFFALKGEHTHGVNFVEEAIEKGCVLVVTDTPLKISIPHILVEDSLKALQELAKKIRLSHKSKVISITGSVGKTTTKKFLSRILGLSYKIYTSPKSYNSLTGLPLSILNAPFGLDYMILELGINKPGEMDILVDIAQPNFCVITPVGRAHIGFFEDQNHIAREKFKILNSKFLERAWIHIRNLSYEYPKENFDCYGSIENVKLVGYEGFSKMLLEVEGKWRIKVKNLGLSYLDLIDLGLKMGSYFGIDKDKILEVAENFEGESMRMEWLKVGSRYVLNDAYNSNPESLENLLLSLQEFDREKLIFVLGDMLELGEKSQKLHYEAGKKFAEMGFKNLIAYGHHSYFLAKAAYDNGVRSVYYSNSLEKVKQLATSFWLSIPESVLVLKASRMLKLEKILEDVCFSTC